MWAQYLIAVLFIAAACIPSLEKFVTRGLNVSGDRKGKMAFLAVLLIAFTVIYVIVSAVAGSSSDCDVKENFFFQVSECNPKCSGLYRGKPATFQFTTIKDDGSQCNTDDCPSYGMIRGCSTARVFGDGYPPFKTKCNEGIC
jgi:hypothetical protein